MEQLEVVGRGERAEEGRGESWERRRSWGCESEVGSRCSSPTRLAAVRRAEEGREGEGRLWGSVRGT